MDDPTLSIMDPAVVRRLLSELARTDIEELEIAHGDVRILVRREPGMPAMAIAPVAQSQESVETAVGVPVVAPLAGVFYGRPSPEETAFVQPGDAIEVGTVIGLIETMKMYNEVASEMSGEVLTVAARDGDLVTAGQPLLFVRPTIEGGM